MAACRDRFSELLQQGKTLDFLVKAEIAIAPTAAPPTTNATAVTIAAGNAAQSSASAGAEEPIPMDQSGPAASHIALGAAGEAVPRMDTSEGRKRAVSQDLIAALPTLGETDLVVVPVLAHLVGEGNGDGQVIHATVE